MNYLISLIILSVLSAGCIGQQEPAESKTVKDYQGLIDYLSATGLNVTQGDEISQSFFSVKGRIIKVNGDDVQIFEYERAADADTEAAQISPDGSTIGTSMITWVSTPHFYKKEKLIVIYIGEKPEVIKGLEKALGKQFAGR